MNDPRLKKLFELARKDAPPAPSGAFDLRVLAAIRREERAAPLTWWDQLGALFPRLALAALLVMAVCVAADYYSASRHEATFTEDAVLFSVNGDGS